MTSLPCFALVGILKGVVLPVNPTVDVFNTEQAAENHASARNAGECYGGAHYVVEPARVVIGETQ